MKNSSHYIKSFSLHLVKTAIPLKSKYHKRRLAQQFKIHFTFFSLTCWTETEVLAERVRLTLRYADSSQSCAYLTPTLSTSCQPDLVHTDIHICTVFVIVNLYLRFQSTAALLYNRLQGPRTAAK